MANTYFDSALTGQQIENALLAIYGVIAQSNNGKVLAIENGKIVARSVQWSGGYVIAEKQDIVTENGVYYAADDHVSGYSAFKVDVSGGGGSTIIAKPDTITQNGTYYASADNADGYSQVIVNVSGGGGGSSYPVIDAYFDGNLGNFFGDLDIKGTVWPVLSSSVLAFMNNYARSKYGTAKNGSDMSTTIIFTSAIAQESVSSFKQRFNTLTQAEYQGNVSSAMISELGLVELGRNVSNNSSSPTVLTLNDSIENYSAVLLNGIYKATPSSSYNTCMLYISPQLNSQYWTGMKDRSTTYDCNVTFSSNTEATLTGGSSAYGREVIIYGVP